MTTGLALVPQAATNVYAQWFWDNQIGVFPIKYREKIPSCPSWDDFSCTREQAGLFQNYGVRLGLLAILDTDSPESEAWAAEFAPPTPFIIDTARGRHRGYRLQRNDVPHHIHRVEMSCEFRHAGQYIVGCGSTHKSGVVYTARDWEWNINAIPYFPVASFVFDDRAPELRGSLPGQPLVIPPTITAGERHDVLFKFVRSLLGKGVPDDMAIAACHDLNNLRCKPPVAFAELDKYLWRVSKYEDRPSFVRCELLADASDIAAVLIDTGVSVETTRRLTKVEISEAPSYTEDIDDITSVTVRPQATSQATDAPKTKAQQTKAKTQTKRNGFARYTKPESKKGLIIAEDQDNIRLAVHLCGAEISYDLFQEQALIRTSAGVQPLDDAAQEELWLQIDREHRFRPGFFFFEKVINSMARANKFHPVRDYLNSLTWDGTPRINTWLVTYGNAADTTTQSDADDSLSYLQAVSSIVLMAAVKRVQEPGCKYDEMLVLESSQGLSKSSALRALCPRDEWFSDDLPLNVDSKVLIEKTMGKWIVEASDLAGKKKADVEQIKAMLSRQVDGPARMAYAHKPVQRPRHFILIGTTNGDSYLTDSTGARRFWPVKVGTFDIGALSRDRDQLWAEAVSRVAQGESIRLPERLWNVAGDEQEARREIDPWEDAVVSVLAELDEDESDDGKCRILRVTAEALFTAVGLGVNIDRRDRTAQIRLSQIMQRLGFTRGNVWDPALKKSVTGYIRQVPHE